VEQPEGRVHEIHAIERRRSVAGMRGATRRSQKAIAARRVARGARRGKVVAGGERGAALKARPVECQRAAGPRIAELWRQRVHAGYRMRRGAC